MIRTEPRTARKHHKCPCLRTIKPGERYLVHVASPNHDDLGNERWWRVPECGACARQSGRGELLEMPTNFAPAFLGHAPVRHGDGDWRCRCGVPLRAEVSNWEYDEPWLNTGRRGARIAMRSHRLDLEVAVWWSTPEGKALEAELSARQPQRAGEDES